MPKDSDRVEVRVTLTRSEHRLLKVRAGEAGVPLKELLAELVRREFGRERPAQK